MLFVTVTTHEKGWDSVARQEIVKWVRLPNKMELHYVDRDDHFGYANILAEYWRKGHSFAVIEPDIVVRPDVIATILHCDCGYGAYPYAWTTNVGPALGCTWFRKEFLKAYPDAMEEVVKRQISWRQVDVVLMRHVLARMYGIQPHVHLPPVEHRNPAKQLLPEADPTPMMEVPLF